MEYLYVSKIRLCQKTSKKKLIKGVDRIIIKGPEDVHKTLDSLLKGSVQESLYALALSTKNEVIAVKEIYRGTINSSVVSPREIYQFALLNNATNLIISHSHPSGDPLASSEDISFTKRLSEVGRLMNLPLLDHIIYTDSDYYSLKEHGDF